MIEVGHEPAAKLVTIRVRGNVEGSDHDRVLPELESAISQSGGTLRALVILDNVGDWDLRALWKDLRFDVRHFDDFERIAILGDPKLEERGTRAASIVTAAKVEYFTIDELDRAREWALSDAA